MTFVSYILFRFVPSPLPSPPLRSVQEMVRFFTDDMISKVHDAYNTYKGAYPAQIRTDYGEFNFYEDKSWFWSFGNQHGLRYSSSDRTVRIGSFDSAHKQQNTGVVKFPNGTMYEGHIQDNLFHGEGVLVSTTEKKTYKGPWVNGIPTGSHAVITYDDMHYVGDCVNAVPHGYGVMTHLATHGVTKGQWKNGVFCESPAPAVEEEDFIISHNQLKIQKKKTTLGAYISPVKATKPKKIQLLKRKTTSSFLNLQSYNQGQILVAIYAIKTLKPHMPDDDTQDYMM